MNKEAILEILKKEMERATGCTEPGSVVLAVSRATKELGDTPDRIDVTVSPSIYKNGVGVGVPGTGMRGLAIAAALGALMGRSEEGLAILDHVDGPTVERAKELIKEDRVSVKYEETPDPLYVKAEVFSCKGSAGAVISNDYSNITEVRHNEQIVFTSNSKNADEVGSILRKCALGELVELVLTLDSQDLKFLIEAAELNHEAAMAGINDKSMKFGPALNRRPTDIPQPFSAMNRCQVLTGAAVEARMLGSGIPIMAVAGSGNHGITSLLGAYAMATERDADDDVLAKALAISCIVTIYIKAHVNRLSAFCGCAVTASTGVAAAGAYLLGGTYEDMVHAMHSVIGTCAGMLCDGAKESCAFKISAAAASAIQFAYLALDGAFIPARMGIVGSTIEETIGNLALLNNPGMVQAEKLILELIEGRDGMASNGGVEG